MGSRAHRSAAPNTQRQRGSTNGINTGGIPHAKPSNTHQPDGTDQAIGGGTPSALADNAGSQPQTMHACRTADRPKSSAARCGSGLARASSQSSTYSPSPASQRAAAGDSVAAANPSGAGYAYAKKAARG